MRRSAQLNDPSKCSQRRHHRFELESAVFGAASREMPILEFVVCFVLGRRGGERTLWYGSEMVIGISICEGE